MLGYTNETWNSDPPKPKLPDIQEKYCFSPKNADPPRQVETDQVQLINNDEFALRNRVADFFPRP